MTLEEMIVALSEKGANKEDIIQGFVNDASSTAVTTQTAGLKTKNANLLQQIKDAKEAATSLPEGFDAELWDTLLAEHNASAENKLKAGEKWDELKAQLIEGHATDTGKLQDTITSLKAALAGQLIDNAAVSAITEAKGNSALLLPHIKANLKMVQNDDGTYQAIVVDSSGEQRYSKVKAGDMMNLSELIGEFKVNESYAAAFTAQSNGGGGGGSGKGFNGKNPFAKGDNFNYTEQAKLMKSDPTLAAQMKATATGASE